MGRIVHKPGVMHSCNAGWTYHEAITLEGGEPMPYGIPPGLMDFPEGTVWECDCGKTWVSQGKRALNDFTVWFKPEGKRARRKRERKQNDG